MKRIIYINGTRASMTDITILIERLSERKDFIREIKHTKGGNLSIVTL